MPADVPIAGGRWWDHKATNVVGAALWLAVGQPQQHHKSLWLPQ
jgi:hypothetical protein